MNLVQTNEHLLYTLFYILLHLFHFIFLFLYMQHRWLPALCTDLSLSIYLMEVEVDIICMLSAVLVGRYMNRQQAAYVDVIPCLLPLPDDVMVMY